LWDFKGGRRLVGQPGGEKNTLRPIVKKSGVDDGRDTDEHGDPHLDFFGGAVPGFGVDSGKDGVVVGIGLDPGCGCRIGGDAAGSVSGSNGAYPGWFLSS